MKFNINAIVVSDTSHHITCGIPVIFNILGYRLNGNGLNNSSEYFMEVLTIPEE